MYECLTWKECYPKTLFPKPWDIAIFISKGKRRETDYERIHGQEKDPELTREEITGSPTLRRARSEG